MGLRSGYVQLAVSQIQRVDFYRRDNLFVLFQARSRRLIGIDQTIKTEVIVVGIVAVVAAEFIPDVAVVSNPPYSVKWIGSDDPTLINDERFAPAGVLAPKSKADFAFVLHALNYLSAKGRAAAPAV